MAENDTLDDWELVNCIATGNATQVWEVKKAGTAQPMAMKLLLAEAFSDPEQKKALKQEATLGKSLQHPNLIQITELKLNKKFGYFIMEYFRAPNLKAVIRTDPVGAQLRAKKMMECLALAVGHMHEKGWIHKDIKPENILVSKTGEVRLIDFSLASKPDSAVGHALTRKNNIVIQGTRTYLAPELIQRQRLTPAADMYSLGIVLYETLVGHPPFRTANPNDLLMMHVRDKPVPPMDLDDNITPELNQLVLKMLSKNPKDRPANMQELASSLRNLKFFKEDPAVVAKARSEKEAASASQVAEDRLNSRLDAQRTEAEGGVPRKASPPKAKPPVPKPEPVKTAAKSPVASPAPPPAMAPPGPQFPGMGFPGVPMPPGYPMPGYPMQPGMPFGGYPGMPMAPGMPFGAYPGMPGQPIPPGGFPGQPMPMPIPPFPAPGGTMPTMVPIPGATPGVSPAAATPVKPVAPPAGATPPKPTALPPAQTQPVEEIPMASMDDLQIE